ncbi:MAG: UMP kinase [Alphaproteobacteria bacterium]
MTGKLPYKRVLVKVSGERLAGLEGLKKGHDHEILDVHAIEDIADELKALQKAGVQVAVVIGGGNMIRGAEVAKTGIAPAQAHQMGMLATVINALALQSVLEGKGVDTRVMSAVSVFAMCEPYIRRRAMRHMEKGRLIIFAAGTGNPFFTTDSAGALRAIEIGADVLIKASKVDGIYTADPKKDKKAKHLARVTYKDVLVQDLKVMDGAAIALCREHKLPLMVCEVGSIVDALRGKAKHTLVE